MKKLHSKSCMLDSFVKACNTNHDLATLLLHDGSERGHHSQELIDLAWILGYTVTEVQRYPLATHPETHQPIEIKFPEGNDVRFATYLFNAKGVVMGVKLGRYHAVYWDQEVAHDPANGLCFNLLNDGKLVTEYFNPYTFLIIGLRNDRSN